jgi:PAS domain S-box-containing protein
VTQCQNIFLIDLKLNCMSQVAKQENFIIITDKNGRLEFEIDQAVVASSKNATDGIIVGDLYGYISDVNESIVKMYGACDKSEIVGRHYLEFLVKEERAQAVQRSMAPIMNNQGMNDEYRVRLKNGEEAKIEVTTSFLRDQNGEKIGFIDVVRKISS